MGTIISSRTPEGVPNDCPVCHSRIRIEPSQPSGDAPCPNCGALLWFFNSPEGVRFYDADAIAPIRERIAGLIGRLSGVNREAITDNTSLAEVGQDTLELVELAMELEDMGLTFPDEDAERLRTVRDVIDYLARRLL